MYPQSGQGRSSVQSCLQLFAGVWLQFNCILQLSCLGSWRQYISINCSVCDPAWRLRSFNPSHRDTQQVLQFSILLCMTRYSLPTGSSGVDRPTRSRWASLLLISPSSVPCRTFVHTLLAYNTSRPTLLLSPCSSQSLHNCCRLFCCLDINVILLLLLQLLSLQGQDIDIPYRQEYIPHRPRCSSGKKMDFQERCLILLVSGLHTCWTGVSPRAFSVS